MDGEQVVRELAERVRELIGDAEERAAKIVREAEADAKRIRETAEAEARERLADVRTALDDLQGKLGAGTSSKSEVEPGPVIVPEPAPPATPMPEPPPIPEPTPEPVPEPAPPPDEADPPSPEPAEPAAANGGRSADKAAARLVAMRMALDGASRDEIDSHLAATYDVDNRASLLDDVLARAKA